MVKHRGLYSMLATSIGLVVVSAAQPAQAFPRKAGGWDIVESGDQCAMATDFEGPGSTFMLVQKSIDGSVIMSITNDNWSAQSGKTYDVQYVIGDVSFGGGTTPGLHHGFVSKFSADFETALATGRSLHVYLDDTRIDQLSLGGTGAALAAVNQCLGQVRGRLAVEKRERDRWAHLPKDPFATAGPPAGSDACDQIAVTPPAPPPPEVPPPPTISRADPDIAAPLRALQAARPATGGSEDQFKQLFANWQKIECAAAPQKVP